MVSGKTLLQRCSYQCIADGRGRREDLRGVAAEICARILFGVVGMGEFVVFAGGFEKNGGWMWLFDGEFVVECVVDVVFWRTLFRAEKYATISGFIF